MGKHKASTSRGGRGKGARGSRGRPRSTSLRSQTRATRATTESQASQQPTGPGVIEPSLGDGPEIAQQATTSHSLQPPTSHQSSDGEVPPTRTRGRGQPNTNTRMPMADLEGETYRLLSKSIAEGTKVCYQGAVNSFQNFRIQYNLDTSWPASTEQVMAFIAQLSLNGLAASTVTQRIAALSYLHNMYEWQDPTKHFLIKKMQEGCRRGPKRKDSRLPITLALLSKLLPTLNNVCSSFYEACLFQAAFLLAFYGFLRVGEFTARGRLGDTKKIIQLQDIQVGNGPLRTMLVKIRYSKTDQYGSSTTLSIKENGILGGCPVVAMIRFLDLRRKNSGPLFCHINGLPLTRYQFGAVVKKALRSTGADIDQYGTHSFRIGAATTAALNGVPPDKIKEMGRWQSETYRSYVRI
ncbi:uncharacterized protein LOC121415177 isoform X1 [Lytechinus variegatus]|uniref:uncharacterized protein LOC121415177 isoform X1 n=1 Tax=Lytechinus variegatus TaxID=7654 RepID=UPI001BB114C5|nr:uncharacterized protein LOC121415177 isoform X1 [Lytechinus variegatus]